MLQWDQASVNSTALAVLSAVPSGLLAAFVEQEQPCTRTSGRNGMSSSLRMAGTLSKPVLSRQGRPSGSGLQL